ncbi:MAG: HAMP domain-containing sensor histidine kinase [Nanoarchaeota archaeon]
MLIDILQKYLLNIDVFHSLTRFLGTGSGELLKRFIELVFYLIITYMIISEFEKNRKREYKYLIVGFLALSFRQLFMVIVYFNRVFSVHKFTRFEVLTSFVDVYLETIALLLVVSAFLFPAFKEKTNQFQSSVLYLFYLISLITLTPYMLFRIELIEQMYVYIVFDLIKIGILISPFFIIANFKKIKHAKAVLLAFFIYLLIPLTSGISLMLIGKVSPKLTVLLHPLPFFAILLLMRTVYLTLVDKAFLNIRLRKSEKLVRYEKDLNKLKDHFISVTSHELRTPITSMKLYLSLFKSGKFGLISAKQRKAIGTVINENNRLADLITNLLTVSKIEANKLVLNITEFQLHEIVDELYTTIARNNNLKVNNKIKKGFVVKGDKNMLKQVYINLVNNAIKFSEKDGIIELRCGKWNNEWFFSVKDNGKGIEKEEIPKLFNKFYQADNTLTRKHQGIGLGLAIVKNIVELHKGRVEVKSEVGKGTEFIVWIPENSE